jgi:hypothetical protein
MGIIKRAGDLVYTFRFLKLLVTDFKDTKAFELGLIDEKGKKQRKAENAEERDAYTAFHRLVFNIKKLIPAGKIGSYASALYLLKDHYNISDSKLEQGLKDLGIDLTDIMIESSQWLVLEDGRLSPGSYKVRGPKLLNKTLDEFVKPKDWVRVDENAYPVGDVFGMNVYEATHQRTNQKVYVTIEELLL